MSNSARRITSAAPMFLAMAVSALAISSVSTFHHGYVALAAGSYRADSSDGTDSSGGDSSTDGGGNTHGQGGPSDGAGEGRPDHGCEVTTHTGDRD